MTVQYDDITSGPYTGNGIADTFPYDFQIFNEEEIVVVQTDTDDVDTVLTLNVDYTVTGVGDDAGGNVVLTAPLTDDYELFLRSDVPETQETAFSSQGAFFPQIHEDAFDKVTALIKQLRNAVSRSLTSDPNAPIGGPIDAGGRRIINLGTPTAMQDAVTKAYVDGTFDSGILGGFSPSVYIATAGQVTFPHVYSPGALLVIVNGSFFHTGFTASDGANVVFDVGRSAGDQVVLLNFTAREINTALASNVTHTALGQSVEETLNDLENSRVINVKDAAYGAVGDGVTDDTAAIQAAIDDAIANTLSVYVPTGSYLISSPITGLDNDIDAFRMFGETEPKNSTSTVGSRLIFTAASGNMFDLSHSFGVHFHNLDIRYNNASYTDDLIFAEWGGVGRAPAYLKLDRCVFGGISPAVSAASCVRLETMLFCAIKNCNFFFAVDGIRTESSCNVFTIEGCVFQLLSGDPIHATDSGQAWDVRNNAFEGMATGNVGALKIEDNFWSLNYQNNWHGDNASGTRTGNWIEVTGSNVLFGSSIIGNFFGACGDQAGNTVIKISRADGLVIHGNNTESTLAGDFINFTQTSPKSDGVSIRGNRISGFANQFLGLGNVNALEIGANSGVTKAVASASSITLPPGQPFVNVTGSTAIDTIAILGYGVQVTLKFSGTITVNDLTGNIQLAGTFNANANDTLTLVSDGITWFEVSRSSN